jgi:ribosome-binding protein aMBF1 (putative translation factor)
MPVAKRSKAGVCGRSLAGFAVSNPAGSIDICVMCCKQRQKKKKAKMQDSKDKDSRQVQVQIQYKIMQQRKAGARYFSFF